MELGTLQQDGDGRWTLTFERRFANTPEFVWRALIGPAHLSKWFPADVDLRLEPGATLHYTFRDGEGMALEGRMLESVPRRLLVCTWDTAVLRFELEEDGPDVVLRFTYTFDDREDAARDAASWHACLDLLEAEVAGEAQRASSVERLAAVEPAYADRMG